MNRHYKGSALVFSLVVLSFLLMSAVSLATISAIARKSSLSSKSSNVAFQSADSVLEVMLQKIYLAASGGGIGTIGALATTIGATGCSGSTINGTTTTDGTYTATLYDVNGTAILCGDTNWQDSARRVKFRSSYGTNTRAVDINITPTCNQVIYDGYTYPASIFKDSSRESHCWMAEDLQTTTGLVSGTDYIKNSQVGPTHAGPTTPPTGMGAPDQFLYRWNTAMNSKPATAGPSREQGICPPGWYIPLASDFTDLASATVDIPSVGNGLSRPLQSQIWSAWSPFVFISDNKETSIFKSFPAGYADGSSTHQRGTNAYYWTSEASGANATVRSLASSGSFTPSTAVDKTTYRSVRCIKY